MCSFFGRKKKRKEMNDWGKSLSRFYCFFLEWFLNRHAHRKSVLHITSRVVKKAYASIFLEHLTRKGIWGRRAFDAKRHLMQKSIWREKAFFRYFSKKCLLNRVQFSKMLQIMTIFPFSYHFWLSYCYLLGNSSFLYCLKALFQFIMQ